MTVIAFDGRFFVADRRATQGNVSMMVEKLFQIEENVCAIVGELDKSREIMHWFKDSLSYDRYPLCNECNHQTALIVINVKKIGKINVYSSRSYIPIEYIDSFYSDGSGGDIALGAMKAGNTALEACRIAAECDVFCGNGFSVFDLYYPETGIVHCD